MFPEPPSTTAAPRPAPATTARRAPSQPAATTAPPLTEAPTTEAPPTTSTIPFSPSIPPLARETPPPAKQGIPGWMLAILGVSVVINLAVLGAYLNRRYHGA